MPRRAASFRSTPPTPPSACSRHRRSGATSPTGRRTSSCSGELSRRRTRAGRRGSVPAACSSWGRTATRNFPRSPLPTIGRRGTRGGGRAPPPARVAPPHAGCGFSVARIGWFWVPPSRGDVFWAPGYVGWVRTRDHVAWVPLAPREVYYGHGNFGRYSTNIRNVNINQVHVTNVYRNVNVTNSVTVVNQTTFVTGRTPSVARNVVVNVREDFAKRRNIVVGSPPIKPVETSYIPVVRQIPEAKRPPTAGRQSDVKGRSEARPPGKAHG